MRAETLLVLLFFRAIGSAPAAGAPAAGGQAAPPKEPVECKIDVVKSYMLKGRLKASEDPIYLCPTIKNSCCTKTDQQKIYHIVNDIVPGRVLEYESKMKLALAKLKTLHARIMTNQPTFSGSQLRKEFCDQQARKVYNFPFNFFYNKVLEEMESIRLEMDSYYQKFFCVICDGNNHQYFTVKGKTPNVLMRGEFCQEILKANEPIIKLFNVELIEYLVSLQNLVDCTHYIKSFNLKFFDEKKQKMMGEISECLNNLESSNFLKSCQSTCEQLKISKIVDLIEGDFEFLIDAVNLFEKFFELKESGNLVSMKLRKFFQRFVVPRKLSNTQQSLFLEKVNKDVESTRKLIQKKPSKIHKKKAKAHKKAQKKSKHEPKSKAHLSKGRLLAEAPKPAQSSSNSTNSTATTKRTAKLVFNRDLFHFYEEITIAGPEKGQLVFRINEPPVDIDNIPKAFGIGTGVNPLEYNTKFELPQETFYKMLFSYRKPDVPDTNLLFFLVDFNSQNHALFKEDLTTHFKVKLIPHEDDSDHHNGHRRRLAETSVVLKTDKKSPL